MVQILLWRLYGEINYEKLKECLSSFEACGVSIAGLAAAKVWLPPETAETWAQRRRHALERKASEQKEREEKILASLAASAGLTMQQLTATLKCTWSGLELLLAEAVAAAPVEQSALIEAAVRNARAAKLLPEASGVEAAVASSRPSPETRRSYGEDVGGDAPLSCESSSLLSGRDTEAALDDLRKDGVILLTGAVPLEALDHLRQQLKIGPAPRPVREVPTREILALLSSTTQPQEPSTGRRHFLLRGTSLAEESLVPLLAPLMPLALRFFAEMRPDASPGCLLNASPGFDPEVSPPRLFLSECQLLISDPGAVHQMWHRDNLKPGLTILLPVSEVTGELGPTELLPGTHHLLRGAGGLGSCFQSLATAGGAVAPAPLSPGDALLFDARLLHRGLGNRSYSNCRVVVVMRLDMLDTAPPGATVFLTTLFRITGKLLGMLSYAYRFLPSPAAVSASGK
eukprot:s7858_g1.t1